MEFSGRVQLILEVQTLMESSDLPVSARETVWFSPGESRDNVVFDREQPPKYCCPSAKQARPHSTFNKLKKLPVILEANTAL
jgi:hypothetical protein